jgi:hypothetical protein
MGKVVATVPIGTGVDGAGFDAATGNAFASNADGTLTVIHHWKGEITGFRHIHGRLPNSAQPHLPKCCDRCQIGLVSSMVQTGPPW